MCLCCIKSRATCIIAIQFSGTSLLFMTLIISKIYMTTTRISRLMVKRCFPWPFFWQHRWEVSFMYQIPTVQAVHILSADMSNPKGSVAKQVTVCFKSLPDASFSQMQMKNRRGPLDFPEKPVWWWNKPPQTLQWRWKLIYWFKQQHQWQQTLANYEFHFLDYNKLVQWIVVK